MHRIGRSIVVLVLFAVLLCGCNAPEPTQPETTVTVQEIYPTSVETERNYYSDGTPASEWKFRYDLDENLVGTDWIEYYEDGSVYRSGLQRNDPQGNLLEYKEDVYFADGSVQTHCLRQYDPDRDTMAVTEEFYLESGIPELLVDGIYNSDCSILLEGEEISFYPNGNPSYRRTVTAEKSLEISYLEDGEIAHSEETLYTYDTQGNLTLSVTSGYDKEHALTYGREIRYSYDADGRKLSERSNYEENGARIEQQQNTWEYDSLGNVVEETSMAYLRGKLQYTTRITYTYDSAGRCIREHWKTTVDGETYAEEYSYQYDEAGNRI